MLSEGEAAPARRPTPTPARRRLGPTTAADPPAAARASAGEHAERARCRHGVLVGRDVAGRRRRHERRQCRAKVARDGAVRATRDARADGVRRPDFLTEAPFEAAARL